MLAMTRISAAMACAILGVSVSAQGLPFDYRLYSTGNCDHSSPNNATWPPIVGLPLKADYNFCYASPASGQSWNIVEIFPVPATVVTYCDWTCSGPEIKSDKTGVNCYLPIKDCIIGSFKVIA